MFQTFQQQKNLVNPEEPKDKENTAIPRIYCKIRFFKINFSSIFFMFAILPIYIPAASSDKESFQN